MLRFHENEAYLKHISDPYDCLLTGENANQIFRYS